jgi:hypothetical protein
MAIQTFKRNLDNILAQSSGIRAEMKVLKESLPKLNLLFNTLLQEMFEQYIHVMKKSEKMYQQKLNAVWQTNSDLQSSNSNLKTKLFQLNDAMNTLKSLVLIISKENKAISTIHLKLKTDIFDIIRETSAMFTTISKEMNSLVENNTTLFQQNIQCKFALQVAESNSQIQNEKEMQLMNSYSQVVTQNKNLVAELAAQNNSMHNLQLRLRQTDSDLERTNQQCNTAIKENNNQREEILLLKVLLNVCEYIHILLLFNHETKKKKKKKRRRKRCVTQMH